MTDTLTTTPTPSAPARLAPDVRLAKQYPEAASWAIGSYRSASRGLARVWPCEPDEERVRYYLWAAKQIRESHAALEQAWTAMVSAFVTMGGLVEDLDEFERTGHLPDVDPDDSHGVSDLLRGTHAPQSVHEAIEQSAPEQMRALKPPRRGKRTCEHCGVALIRPRNAQKYCSSACREAVRDVERGRP